MAISANRHQLEKDKFVERSDGQTAVAIDLGASAEISLDANSISTSGLVGKSSGGDFTTAYAGATTIDCTSLPTYHGTLIADDIISVVQVATGGGVTATYHRDDVVMTVATNTITVTGAAFVASDTFVVYTNIARQVALAANSGVDIGDVDVTSLPALPAGTNNIGDVDVASIANGSINGPAAPTVDSYTGLVISAVTGANQSLVAAPGASKQIWVYGYSFTVDTDDTIVAFQDEDDAGHVNYSEGFKAGGGVVKNPSGNFAMPAFKVATNKALEADVSVGTIGGELTYAIVSV